MTRRKKRRAVMPDISMCSGDNCPIKAECFRFTAVPSEYVQAYFTAVPYDEKTGCEFFWDNKDRPAVKTYAGGKPNYCTTDGK